MFELLSPILSLVTTWFTGVQKLQQAKQDTALAVEQNKARLALDTMTHNAEWEMAELAQSDTWMRRISFFLFSTPFVVAVFSPVSVQKYFDVALSTIPHWYCVTYMAITGAIWGISALKNPLSQVFSAVKGTDESGE